MSSARYKRKREEPSAKGRKRTDMMGGGELAPLLHGESQEAASSTASSMTSEDEDVMDRINATTIESDDSEPEDNHRRASRIEGVLPRTDEPDQYTSVAYEVPANVTATESDDSEPEGKRPRMMNASEEYLPRPARPDEPGQYSSISLKMMSKMGYKTGQGLGRLGQGIVEPVGMSTQRGRRGLGLVIKGLEMERVNWDISKERVEAKEEVEWTPEHTGAFPSLDELTSWIREGPRHLEIAGNDRFCDPVVLENVISSKSVFDHLEGPEMRKARSRSNPYETIRGGCFLNRAAMKMANMDAVFGFMFTDPRSRNGRPLVGPNDLLFFADVCAGPGGFSEYVLWRKRWRSRGFGFTLRGPCDFKLEDFFVGPPETFEPHYGVNGLQGDGDVFREDNIEAFRDHVLTQTDGLGVHFMMADGGFSVEGQENVQEILSKQLYLCQCLVALSVVRPEGHFVCKLFDLFTPFSVGLVYLMRMAFAQVCIHKPNTSRPANSERYIICKWRRGDSVCSSICEYLFMVNRRLNELGMSKLGQTTSTTDVLELVPTDLMERDVEFLEYMVKSNNTLGERQILGLTKIAAFCKDETLLETRQPQMKKECLEYWNVPNEARKAPDSDPADFIVKTLLKEEEPFLSEKGTMLTPQNLTGLMHSAYDFKFVLLAGNDESRGFFLGLGRTKVFRLMRNQRWERVDERRKFELPPKTLIYAELVQEFRGEARRSVRHDAVHIIDAAFIGGDDLRNYDVKKRAELVRILCRSVNKPTHREYAVLRPKELHSTENLPAVLRRLAPRLLKTGGPRFRLTSDLLSDDGNEPRYFVPTGACFFPVVQGPYMMALSRSANRKYWYDIYKHTSAFECPKDACPNFATSFSKRLLWQWGEGVSVIESAEYETRDESKLQGRQLVQLVEKLTHKS